MSTDDLNNEFDDLEFEKQMEKLEINIKHEKRREKSEIMAFKISKNLILNILGVLYLAMIIFEWILLYIMAQIVLSPIDYAMSTPGEYQIAGSCFLILSFILNLHFQISKINYDSGKFSFYLGIIGATLLFVSAFTSFKYPDIFSEFPITIIIITVVLLLLGCLQFSQIFNKNGKKRKN